MNHNYPELARSSGNVTDTDNTIDEEKGTGTSTPIYPPQVNVADEEKELAESTPPTTSPPEFSRAVKGWKWVSVCVGIYMSAFLYGLDNTIAADIQGAVVETYGDISKLTWLGSGFPLGSIATILTLGKAYGIFNVKWLHIGSVTTFSIGSAICGAAPNMNALIIGRVIAGVGGAGMYLGTLNLLTINTSLRERPVYMGGVGIVWGAGTILGPVIGGSFADSAATWRWAFYINLVIFGVMGPAMLLIPTYNPQPEKHALIKLRQLDWVGALLNAGIYVSFVIALTFGGAAWSWSSGRTIATFVVCLATVIIFAVQQYFAIFTTPTQRLFPIEFLKSRTMILLHIATAASGTALFVPVFYIPLLFQFVHGDSGLQSAVRLLPFILVDITFIMGQGILMPLIGYYLPFFILSGIFCLIGSALMYTVTATTSTSAIYGFSVLIAIGAGLTSQAAYSIAPAKVLPHQIPAAIGFINVAQLGGVVLALTISGAVFQNTAFRNLEHVLQGMGFSGEDIRSAIAGSQSVVFERLGEEVRGRAIEGIVQAVDKTYALIIAGSALALVTSVFLRWERLFMEVGAGGA